MYFRLLFFVIRHLVALSTQYYSISLTKSLFLRNLILNLILGYDGSINHTKQNKEFNSLQSIIHSNKALPVHTNTVALLNSVTALCNFSFVTQAVVVLYSS